MNSAADQSDQLQKLLALKRHEKPPPGYFHTFSNNVMARINSSEGDAEGRWLLNFWQRLTARPILSGAVAAGVFGLLVFSLLAPTGTVGQGAPAFLPPDNAFAGATKNSGLGAGPSEVAVTEELNSTNPVSHVPSLFDPVGLKVEKVNYRMNGN
jgi:hypothetical protein